MEEAKILNKEEDVKEEEQNKDKPKYNLGEVVTGIGISIVKDGNALTDQQALVEILNKLDRLEKNMIGG